MTADLFATIFITGSILSSLFTQAVKKVYENIGKEYKPNILALIDAIVVGCGGTAILYQLYAIPWTFNNIICLILMGIATWIGSMVGYDKVIQTLQQLGILPGKEHGNASSADSND